MVEALLEDGADNSVLPNNDPGPLFCLVEKSVILVSLLAGFSLVYLDRQILGFRRFVWAGASFVGLYHLFLVDDGAEPELAGQLDKASIAMLSVTTVPHLAKLIQDQSWVGLGVVPPFLMVTFQTMITPVDPSRQDYWALRCFLHLFIFVLPYLNHLPSGPPPPDGGAESGEATGPGDDQGTAATAPTKTGEKLLSTTPDATTTLLSATSGKKNAKPRTNKKKR